MRALKSLFTDMHFNLALYCAIAFFTALTGVMSSDEAAKYITPALLFWVRTFCTVSGATLLAAKMFLSTTYAEYRAKRDGVPGMESGDTQTITLRDTLMTAKTVPGK